jgi:hypothetical protein
MMRPAGEVKVYLHREPIDIVRARQPIPSGLAFFPDTHVSYGLRADTACASRLRVPEAVVTRRFKWRNSAGRLR